MDYMPSWRRGEERDAIKQRCWQIYATGYRRHSEKERGETALQTPDNHLKRRRKFLMRKLYPHLQMARCYL